MNSSTVVPDMNGRDRAERALSVASKTVTQIYTHVMQKPGLGVRSPLDALQTVEP